MFGGSWQLVTNVVTHLVQKQFNCIEELRK